MIKAIVFDADGVVIKAPKMFSQILAETRGVTTEQTLVFFKGIFQECLIGKADLKVELLPFLQKWGIEDKPEAFITQWFVAENHLVQEIIDLIFELRNKSIKCYLATNNEYNRTQFMRNEMGFNNIFDEVYSSADLNAKKPEREFFTILLKKIKLEPGEVLFIDDAYENIAVAEKMGIRSHLYSKFGKLEQFMNENL